MTHGTSFKHYIWTDPVEEWKPNPQEACYWHDRFYKYTAHLESRAMLPRAVVAPTSLTLSFDLPRGVEAALPHVR